MQLIIHFLTEAVSCASNLAWCLAGLVLSQQAASLLSFPCILQWNFFSIRYHDTSLQIQNASMRGQKVWAEQKVLHQTLRLVDFHDIVH